MSPWKQANLNRVIVKKMPMAFRKPIVKTKMAECPNPHHPPIIMIPTTMFVRWIGRMGLLRNFKMENPTKICFRPGVGQPRTIPVIAIRPCPINLTAPIVDLRPIREIWPVLESTNPLSWSTKTTNKSNVPVKMDSHRTVHHLEEAYPPIVQPCDPRRTQRKTWISHPHHQLLRPHPSYHQQ